MKKAISQLRFFLECHGCLKWISALLRKLGIVRLLHWIYEKNDSKTAQEAAAFKVFYEQNRDQFEKLSGMLEDDLSRKTLDKVVQFRHKPSLMGLKSVYVQPQYFQKDIFGPLKDEVFVDGGAYIGDTIDSYMKFSGGVYKRIYAWEPDEDNIKWLEKYKEKYDNITVVPCGLWSEKTELSFLQGVGNGSRIQQDAQGEVVLKVKVDSIDNVCADDKVTFIKMDIEGSEMEALKGAVNVIKRDKPRLAICIYHEPEHLYEIPFWIKQTVPEYKLYMRQHSCGRNETVIYATV